MNFLPMTAAGNNAMALGEVPPRRDLKATTSEIRLLTLNLGLPCLAIAGGWRLPLAENHADRLLAAPEILASVDADVIALQEVYSPAVRSHLIMLRKAWPR